MKDLRGEREGTGGGERREMKKLHGFSRAALVEMGRTSQAGDSTPQCSGRGAELRWGESVGNFCSIWWVVCTPQGALLGRAEAPEAWAPPCSAPSLSCAK